MPQTRLTITVPAPQAQALFAALEQEFEEDGLPLGIQETFDGSGVFDVALYGQQADAAALADRMRDVAQALGIAVDIEQSVMPDIDWVAHSLEGLPPVRAGRFVVHGGHDRAAVKPSDIGLWIEAGQAFGTGHHGTTAGCLEMLGTVMRRRKPAKALDLGTGSAVLAIAIGKAARIPVLATDIDPVATAVARENVAKNGVRALVRAETATGFAHASIRMSAPFDLIVANILARPLMRLAPEFSLHLARGGTVVLSGILASQRRQVLAAFRTQGLYHRETLPRGDWVTLRLDRG